MYAKVLGASTVTVATVGAATLPNTGSNLFTNLAVAVSAGLVAWGITYTLARN